MDVAMPGELEPGTKVSWMIGHLAREDWVGIEPVSIQRAQEEKKLE